MLSRSKQILLVFSFFVLSILVTNAVYSFTDIVNQNAPQHKINGEIDTTAKLWLNGKLGTFFRFKFSSNLNWLILPLLFIFFISIKKRQRWERALFFLYLSVLCLFTLYGYANYRYTLALIPFTTTLLLLLGWDALKCFSSKSKIFVIATMIGLAIGNIYKYKAYYNIYSQKLFYAKNEHPIPWKIIQYLRGLELAPEENILVCQAPIFYFYTNKKGIPYNLSAKTRGVITHKGRDDPFDVNGAVKTDPKSMEKAFKRLKNYHKVKYLLIPPFLPYFFVKGPKNIAQHGAKLVVADRGFALYKLKDRYFNLPAIINDNLPLFKNDFTKKFDVNTDFGNLKILRKDPGFVLKENKNGLHIQRTKNTCGVLQIGYKVGSENLKKKNLALKITIRSLGKKAKNISLLVQEKGEYLQKKAKDIEVTENFKDYFLYKPFPHNKKIFIGISLEMETTKSAIEIAKSELYVLDQ